MSAYGGAKQTFKVKTVWQVRAVSNVSRGVGGTASGLTSP